jgi:hypothetical protein
MTTTLNNMMMMTSTVTSGDINPLAPVGTLDLTSVKPSLDPHPKPKLSLRHSQPGADYSSDHILANERLIRIKALED